MTESRGDPPDQEHSHESERGAYRLGRGRRASDETGSTPTLEDRQIRRGQLPGSRYVRIVRPREFRRRSDSLLVATDKLLEPKGLVAQGLELARRTLFGTRLRSEVEAQERVGKVKGLAIFASDNISSSAYATEEVMRTLALAGIAALTLTLPITVAIVAILGIVVTSYLQVIRAYPGGGGSYAVARASLGAPAGLAAGAALLTDYILTVAVSTSAGVAAITSAFPELFAQRVPIAVGLVTLVTIVNLRGIRESGAVFAAPTYVYVGAILGLLGFGLFRAAMGDLPAYSAPPEWMEAHHAEPLALLLILRAFASGSVALTGTEAISNSVPSFSRPEVRNAQVVLVVMGSLFGTIFVGISVLAGQMGIVPDPEEVETVLSQLARTLVGGGSPYYLLVQYSTALLLVLAANTAFTGFPRLASILAADHYLPRPFQFRGDRLAFTAGIVVLALVSAGLIVAYKGSVTDLIPLYTVGVFLAFTLSQMGLVRHWWGLRAQEPGWQRRVVINGIGATATGVVAVVVTISKFTLGAWMILVLIPVLAGMMWATQRHYRNVADALTPDAPDLEEQPAVVPEVVVPVSRLDRATLRAVGFARAISEEVTAVHVTDDVAEGEALRQRWVRHVGDVPLVIIESPYRVLLSPLLAYIEDKDRNDPRHPITVVLTEFVPRHFWEYFLHNHTAFRLKLALFFRPNTVVIDVPYHLGHGADGQEDDGAEAGS